MSRQALLRYLTARLGQAVLVVVAAYTVTFAVLDALPGSAVNAVTGAQPNDVTPQQLQALKVAFGLNRSLWSQWWLHFSEALGGNLGRSYVTGEQVSGLLWANLPSTAALTGLALVMSLAGGIALALWATIVDSPRLRGALLGLPPLGAAIPSFWLGLMLLQALSFDVHIFPGTGDDGFASLVLPAVTLAVPTGSLIASLLAKSLDRALIEPYADTARAKGASEARVQFRHALRNALTSTVTVSGVVVGQLLAGAVVVESVFSRAGLGQLTESAISEADIPVVQGIVLLGALTFVVANLVVDLIYPLLDRRVVLTYDALRT